MLYVFCTRKPNQVCDSTQLFAKSATTEHVFFNSAQILAHIGSFCPQNCPQIWTNCYKFLQLLVSQEALLAGMIGHFPQEK
jgi:hypothetical protein